MRHGRSNNEIQPKGKVHGDPMELPRSRPGAMAASNPSGRARQMQALGFPGELVDDWQDKAIAEIGELLVQQFRRCGFISTPA